MGSVEFFMTICMLSFDSMIYLNQFYDRDKALEGDECIQNPETLPVYIFESEKKRKTCSLLFCEALYFMAKNYTVCS